MASPDVGNSATSERTSHGHLAIAFQGEIGAYSEEAVQQLAPGARSTPCPSFEDVFGVVVAGDVDAGVVPIENSLFGSVHANYDLLREYDVRIVAETQVRIRHNLMALPGAEIGAITEVHSHPQALGQCKTFLREKLPHASVIAAYDTAGAAKSLAADASRNVAAIASSRAAAHYGLDVLASGIESNHQNYTRFLAIVPAESEISGRKAFLGENQFPPEHPFTTSVVYAMHAAVSGALFNSLAVFARRNIDLRKIESRPLVGRPGSYLFYLDLEGQADEESVASALQQLAESTDYIEVMGSYPRAAYDAEQG